MYWEQTDKTKLRNILLVFFEINNYSRQKKRGKESFHIKGDRKDIKAKCNA